MGDIVFTYVICLAVVVICATTCFALSRYLDKRDDFADVAWGVLFIVIAICSYGMHAQEKITPNPALVVVFLVSTWGLRLILHIGLRFVRSKQEDGRYRAMRVHWSGSTVLNSYVRVFLLQGLLALAVAAPIIFTSAALPDFSWLFYAGIAIWSVGFLCEVIADWQLRCFMKVPNHKGTLMTSGLWRYSRHPNYFGELTLWWGLGIVALSVPFGWVALSGPLLLTFLIIKVSGVPPAEARAARKPGWEEYKAATSMLIPFPPKKPKQVNMQPDRTRYHD
ncbi:MAG: DUF1295 domain-containing protein [Candidatus Saccharimonadales bacterium]